ncbi:MAG: GNAT family N-acetyltransferase [Actinomycetota bacterium]|nr:GNAT family N-acetyltransferase [Actinomycetota bacterium]
MIARLAGAADSALLLTWRNDPLTRANSVNQDAVAEADHQRWLAGVLTDPDRSLWIVEEDQPLGVVRFDRTEGDEFEVSVTVAPAARGRGLARSILLTAQAQVRPARIVARIREDNHASLRLFEGAGYVATGQTDGDFVFYRY